MSTPALLRLPVEEYLARLAAREPTPGGGSVAALAGALAAGLGQMVSAYSTGPKFADVAAQIAALAARFARAGEILRQLVDEDAAAYDVLSAALHLPKTAPQRPQQVAQAATLAAQVPLETAATSARVLADVRALRTVGNAMLRADIDAAEHLARAAVHAAAGNVRANLPLMPASAAEAIGAQLEALLGATA